jgi:hypothetical protein
MRNDEGGAVMVSNQYLRANNRIENDILQIAYNHLIA